LQQFLRTRDTHIADLPDSFVHLRDNGENENPIWKEFEVTFQDRSGNVRLGPDGNSMVAIAPPPSDLCGRVFLAKPDERGEVKRARVVELIKDFEGNVAKNKDLIKFKFKYDHNDLEDVMSYNEIQWGVTTTSRQVGKLEQFRLIWLCTPRNMIFLRKKDGNELEELLTKISIFNGS
jgi:hypothetical protein